MKQSDNCKNVNPHILWIKFNNSRVGCEARRPFLDFINSNNINLNLVPIIKDTVSMNNSSNTSHEVFRFQFPLIPAEAMTIRKYQGVIQRNVS